MPHGKQQIQRGELGKPACFALGVYTIREVVLVSAQCLLLPVNGHLNPSRERLPLIKFEVAILSRKSQTDIKEHREYYLVIKHGTKL